MREDESREARDRKWEARNRCKYAEAEQGNRGGQGSVPGTDYTSVPPPRISHRRTEPRPSPVRNVLSPPGELGHTRDLPSEDEFLAGDESRTEDGYITWDDMSESEGEDETESISDETGSSESGRNEDENMLTAIIAAMSIQGTGLEQGLRQGSVEASIRRLMEAVKDAAVSRSMESGNGSNSGKKKAE